MDRLAFVAVLLCGALVASCATPGGRETSTQRADVALVGESDDGRVGRAGRADETTRERDPSDDAASAEVTTPAPAPAGTPADAREADGPVILQPFEYVTVRLDESIVEIVGFACLRTGWLEQIVCTPYTREHEALIVTPAIPSHIHAALLMAGFEPGAPGRWHVENDALRVDPPRGDRIAVFVRYTSPDGETIEEPIRNWIRDHLGRAEFPDDPWVFGGSILSPNPEWMGPGEHYVADMTGSVIGLVTFGDELLGFSQVLSDIEAVQPPEWEVRSDHVPPEGTQVRVILRRADP